ncbi:hypothetical protein ACFPRL_20130 [Pseudoclavibacter helvolus]
MRFTSTRERLHLGSTSSSGSRQISCTLPERRSVPSRSRGSDCGVTIFIERRPICVKLSWWGSADRGRNGQKVAASRETVPPPSWSVSGCSVCGADARRGHPRARSRLHRARRCRVRRSRPRP